MHVRSPYPKDDLFVITAMRLWLVLVAATVAALWLRKRMTGPPAPRPPTPPVARLRFSVRRRRRRQRKVDSIAATDSSPAAMLLSLPPPSPSWERGSLHSATIATSGKCGNDGSQTGSGCNGHTCFIGACFCADGSGGESCERGQARVRTCDAFARDAYKPGASDITRFSALDQCAFYEPAYGIIRVDEKRWREAQQWEAAMWAEAPAAQTTDRNDHHAAQFDRYAALPASLGHVVELGCGPYTQLQTILQLRSEGVVKSITLVDPLAAHYMARTKGCTYRDSRLISRPARVVTQAAEDFLMPNGMLADVLIMTFVLQSVRSVPAVLQSAFNALRPGGWLVFADRVFDARWDSTRAGGDAFWDVGHPCSIKQTVLDHFLEGFEEVYSRRHVKEGSRQGTHAHRDEQYYFIGRRRSSMAQ